MSWIKPDVWHELWGVDGEAEFVQKLNEIRPKFAKDLSAFVGGEVRMDDGSEHPLLASVAEKVLAGSFPTDGQAKAFSAVVAQLQRKRRTGSELRLETEADKKLRAAQSLKAIDFANTYKELFNKKTADIVESMTAFCDEHQTLTPKQLEFLTKIIDTLPQKCFEAQDVADQRG